MAYFEMFTEEGNMACTQALENIKSIINSDRFVSEDELKSIVKSQVKQVAAKHGEVYDTEPEWHLEDRINQALEAKGYGYKVSRYDFH